MNYSRYILFLFIALSLLAIPYIAMNFTDEVNWSGQDFLIVGILLFSLATFLEFILRIFRTKYQRILASTVIIILFLLVWVELAVGIFNSPFAGS